MNAVLKTDNEFSMMETVVNEGDLAKLSPKERVLYVKQVCQSLGLNPLTQPFKYIRLNGKLTLYTSKDATEQLRKIRGVSIFNMKSEIIEGVYVVTVNARDKDGREDIATGAVTIEGLKGENRANAIMKAETKAKRRVTLSICGLGFLDESEVDSVPTAVRTEVCMETGEILEKEPVAKTIDDYVEEIRTTATEGRLRTVFMDAAKLFTNSPADLKRLVNAKDLRKVELKNEVHCEAV